MSSEIKPLKYDNEYNIITSNKLIKGKQPMTLQVARIIRLVISQVAKADKDLRTYTCKIIDLAEILGIPKNDMYRDIERICEEMLKTIVSIETGNPKDPWDKFHWVSRAKYDGHGEITIRLSDEIKPYVIELNNYFTKYKISEILTFKSYYAIRIYEIILCTLGEKNYKNREKTLEAEQITLTIEELRMRLGCEKKLSSFGDFKKRAIEVAVREINEKTAIYVMATYNKKGKKVVSVTFTVVNNIIYLNNNKFLNDYKTVCDITEKITSGKCKYELRRTSDEDVIKKLNAQRNEKSVE